MRDVTITTGLVDTSTTPTLVQRVRAGRLDAGRLVTHRFDFDEGPQAYDVFGDPESTGALKIAVLR
jgi:alcohol dehydrogenase